METVCLALGIIIGGAAGYFFGRKETEEEPEALEEKEETVDLRAGMGVYRHDDPTFAEQFVNIINYNGENQKEGDYEER